jgi:outer membrane protein OmpA-like peptidoglycan-associated protein
VRQINCYIPIKVCITGQLSDAQLDQLGQTLTCAITARMEQARHALGEHGYAPSGEAVASAREPVDHARLSNGRYGLPSYDTGGEAVRVPVIKSTPSIAEAGAETTPAKPVLRESLYYAFFFTGGNYGRNAEEYIRQFFPEHHRFQARSFEQMFSLLANDIRIRARHSRYPVVISEIVIVTHANAAGGMKIPLTNDRRGRIFDWREDLPDFQNEFRRGLYRRFKQDRREVVAALSDSTQIIVRGCQFGQSQEALDALRIFFGGQPVVYAPKGYQAYEPLPVGRLGSILRTQEEAFDFLVTQGYLPEDQRDIPVEEKKKYIRNVFGTEARIPAEFFIMSKAEHEELDRLIAQRLEFTSAAEPLVRRPFEEGDPGGAGVNIPRPGEYWGTSVLNYDPEFDALSIEAIEARARQLNNPYRPQNAAMLLRLRAAWDRKQLPERPKPYAISQEERDTPLADAVKLEREIFGDFLGVSDDAVRFPGPPPPDLFETETLPRRTVSAEERRATRDFRDVAVFEKIDSSGMPQSEETTVSRDGRVDSLPDGMRLWDFGVNSANLRPAFNAALQQVAQKALAEPAVRIRLEGHTSSSGTKRDNEQLSQTRADTVRQVLIHFGVVADRIQTVGLGASVPVAQERVRGRLVPENLARNRCVDVILVRPSGAPPPSTPGETQPSISVSTQSSATPAEVPWWLPPGSAFNYEFPEITLLKPRDVGPVQISMSLQFKVQISELYASPKTKIGFTWKKARADIEWKMRTIFGDLTPKVRVEPGKFSRISVGKDLTDWCSLEFAANSDLSKLGQARFKFHFDGSFQLDDWTFKGTIEGVVNMYFGPSIKWIAEKGLQTGVGQVIVRALARAGIFARGLFIVEEIGTVTILGAVGIGVAVGVAAVVIPIGALYLAGKATEEGWALAAGYSFAAGYASMFALLTEPQPIRGGVGDPTPVLLKAYSELLGRDWRRQLQEYREAYVQAMRDDEDQKARHLSGELYQAGRAAAFQGWHQFMSLYPWEEWKRFARATREEFGESMQQRIKRVDWFLHQQIRRDEAEIGIQITLVR